MDLPVDEDGNLECTICSEPIGIPQDDGTIESPVELPCGHTFGDTCLDKWRRNNNICPNCRAPCPGDGRPATGNAFRSRLQYVSGMSHAQILDSIDAQIQEMTNQLDPPSAVQERLDRRNEEVTRVYMSRYIAARAALANSDDTRGRLPSADTTSSHRRARAPSTELVPDRPQVGMPTSGWGASTPGHRTNPFLLDFVGSSTPSRPADQFFRDSLTNTLQPALSTRIAEHSTRLSAPNSLNQESRNTSGSLRHRRTREPGQQSGVFQPQTGSATETSPLIGRTEVLNSQQPHLLAQWLHQQNLSELSALRLIERLLWRRVDLNTRQRMANIIRDGRRTRMDFINDLVDSGVSFIADVGPLLRRIEGEAFENMSELHRIRRETQEAVAEGRRTRTQSTTPPSIRETWERIGGRWP